MSYEITSPDGFSITPMPAFRTMKAALEYYERWKERFKHQGYYLDMNRRKLALEVLDNNCNLIKYQGRNNPIEVKRLSEVIKPEN